VEASVRSYFGARQYLLAATSTSTAEADGAWDVLHGRSPHLASELAEVLAGFYIKSGRTELPWRQSRDPYEILVAEFMLQKTHHRVVPAVWSEFLRRWPRVENLARAREASIELVLLPLGLPRRAQQLRAMAKVVCANGGCFPRTRAELLALPGVGPYTAAAVLSQCFGQATPMIDANAARVYCRAYGFRPLTLRQAQRFAERVAHEVLCCLDPRSANLAILDFAHAVCRLSPLCNECNLRFECAIGRAV
jgi:A/G-specific adenine glycosylase